MPADLSKPYSPPPRRGLARAGIVAVVIAAVVVVIGILTRVHRESETRQWTDQASVPAVSVIRPAPDDAASTLVLPGTLQAYYNALIFSRVPGYVRSWSADIGARVRTGEVLAIIDTPELDQQIAQARADLATATANRQLAATTAARWTRLLAQDAVSKQETDEKTGDLMAKSAQVDAARANLQRLTALKGFARIVAPFDGVVTARKTDIGALVNAGAGASANSELFDVAKVDRLRLYVRVPQVNSAAIRPGMTVNLTVPELPGRTFPARLTTTSGSISDASGTLLTELLVDNPGDVLKPGAYAQVSFELPSDAHTGYLLLPSSALIFRSRGLEAAVVDASGHVQLRRLKAGRDLGSQTEIASGLSPGDRVVNNPPDSIAEGELVRVVGGGKGER